MSMNTSLRRTSLKVLASTYRSVVSLDNMFFCKKMIGAALYSILRDTATLKGDVFSSARLIISLFSQYFTFLGDDTRPDDPRIAYDHRVILDTVLFRICGNDPIKERAYLNAIGSLLDDPAAHSLSEAQRELALNTIQARANPDTAVNTGPERWSGLTEPKAPSRQVLKITGDLFWDRNGSFKDIKELASATIMMFMVYLASSSGDRDTIARDIETILYYTLELGVADEITDATFDDKITFMSELDMQVRDGSVMFRTADQDLLLDILHPLFQAYKMLAPRRIMYRLGRSGQVPDLIASGILLIDPPATGQIIVTLNGRGEIWSICPVGGKKELCWLDMNKYKDSRDIHKEIQAIIPLVPEGALSTYVTSVFIAFTATVVMLNTVFGLILQGSDKGLLLLCYAVLCSLAFYPQHMERNALIKLAKKTWENIQRK